MVVIDRWITNILNDLSVLLAMAGLGFQHSVTLWKVASMTIKCMNRNDSKRYTLILLFIRREFKTIYVNFANVSNMNAHG